MWIRTHIFVCFLALLLKVVFQKELRKINENLQFSKVLDDIRKMKAVQVTLSGKSIILRTELERDAHLAFKAAALDSSGKGNNLKLKNIDGSNWVEGKYGKALKLNGINQYAYISDANQTELDMGTSDFTIEVVLSTTLAKTERGENRYIVVKRAGDIWYCVKIADDNRIYGWIKDGTNAYLVGLKNGLNLINDGKFHHLVVVFERDLGGKIYIDGKEQKVDSSGDITEVGSLDNSGAFQIGKFGAGDYLECTIDEVRISKTVLM